MQQQDMEAIIRAMEQSDPNTREAARKIRSAMGTQEGRQTAQDVTRRYGSGIAAAASKMQSGDPDGAKQLIQGILNTPDGAKLAAEIARLLR